jgi:hypothetical protein
MLTQEITRIYLAILSKSISLNYVVNYFLYTDIGTSGVMQIDKLLAYQAKLADYATVCNRE